jgi:TatA/E family protein of Tat protein translocase
MSLGFTEIVIIGIAAVVLLFGGKKITELAKAAGRATGEYKKARRDIERELANDDVVDAAVDSDAATKVAATSVTPTGQTNPTETTESSSSSK